MCTWRAWRQARRSPSNNSAKSSNNFMSILNPSASQMCFSLFANAIGLGRFKCSTSADCLNAFNAGAYLSMTNIYVQS